MSTLYYTCDLYRTDRFRLCFRFFLALIEFSSENSSEKPDIFEMPEKLLLGFEGCRFLDFFRLGFFTMDMNRFLDLDLIEDSRDDLIVFRRTIFRFFFRIFKSGFI